MRQLIEDTNSDAARLCAHYEVGGLEEISKDTWKSLRGVLTNKLAGMESARKKTGDRSDELKGKVRENLKKAAE